MSPGGFIDRIRAAHADGAALVIRGHGSKAFYGNPVSGEALDTTPLRGVVDYQPQELVLTARAGTPLAEIEALLAGRGQMLPFEPPHFGGAGTLGGAVAAGLSGPRRAYAGAARDFVLGVRLIDGTGQTLRFGGRVIKNVAGYDVSRLMAGALGTLGLLTEISLKVLPRPAEERTLQLECDEEAAILKMNQWAGQPLPLSATSWHGGLLSVRLSGARSAVRAAHTRLGGETVAHADEFWARLRDHRAAFFETRHKPLWRIALPATAAVLSSRRPALEGDEWIEWGGALRWLACDAPAAKIRETVRQLGGHATFFPSPRPHSIPREGQPIPGRNPAARAGGEPAGREMTQRENAFTPLSPALLAIHKALKQRFDPHGIFNRGRLTPEF